MTMLKIPAGPRELTAEWLTHALRQTGTITDAAVVSFDNNLIAEGVGLMGQLARLSLRYNVPEPGAPRSLIAKFPAASEENRKIGNIFRIYEREIRFYEEIAGDVDLRTPRRYFSAMDVEAGEYVLLLEDLAPARVGDQLHVLLRANPPVHAPTTMSGSRASSRSASAAASISSGRATIALTIFALICS